MIKYAKIWWYVPEVRYHATIYLLAHFGYMFMACISLPLTIPMAICYVLEIAAGKLNDFIDDIGKSILRKPTMFFINVCKEHHIKAIGIVPHEEIKKRIK